MHEADTEKYLTNAPKSPILECSTLAKSVESRYIYDGEQIFVKKRRFVAPRRFK
jgi:hypothetical protein